MRNNNPEHRVNYFIKSQKVRLVGDNIEVGVYDTKIALKMANELGLDLVEISNNNNSEPICKIIDYKKFIFDKKKKEKDLKKKQKQNQIEVKEIRMTPNIDEHDFNFKLAHAKNFLKENNRVLTSVFFKGREITYKEQGEIVLLKFADELKGIGIPEHMPKLEGKRMLMMIKPIKR